MFITFPFRQRGEPHAACQIVELAGALAETQERLVQLAARLDDDDPEDLRERYKALQDAHKEAVNSAKWLRAQNIDLELRLQQHKPEVNNAVAARDMAFQKLKHARKVIRDLLAERVGSLMVNLLVTH